MMVVGEKRRAWIPEALAYKGRADRPKGMLVFDIELMAFNEMPVVPADVAAPPADAVKTKSGLVSKVLRAGDGHTRRPKSSSTVTVHYTGCCGAGAGAQHDASPDFVFTASAGMAATSGGATGISLNAINSISNTSIPLGRSARPL